MADDALDAESLRRDRDRYQRFLLQVEQQLANCNERMQQLHQAIDALDRLLALTDGPGLGAAPGRRAPEGASPAQGDGRGRRGAPGDAAQGDGLGRGEPQGDAAQGEGLGRPGSSGDAVAADPAPRPRAAPKSRSRRTHAATPAPPPTATPAAPDPVEPPAATTAPPAPVGKPSAASGPPKGTDALRLVLESEPTRTWSLGELLDALEARGWLPSSRRPEEGVRISLKRLVERGGAVRAANGRWRHPSGERAAPNGSAQALDARRLTVAPPPEADEPPATEVPPQADDPVEASAAAAPQAIDQVDPSASAAPQADGPVEPSAAAAPPADDPVEVSAAAVAPRGEARPHSAPAPEPRQPAPPPRRPASFGLPVGGTVTEL